MCLIFTPGRHRRRRVLSSVIASVRPSVRPSVCPSRTTLPLYLFEDFSYQRKIWWDDAQYNGVYRSMKWQCSANFCVFHGTLKFSMICFWPCLRDDVTALTILGFRVSAWTLVGWCTVTRSKWVFNVAVLGYFFAFRGILNFSISCLDQVWGTMLPL